MPLNAFVSWPSHKSLFSFLEEANMEKQRGENIGCFIFFIFLFFYFYFCNYIMVRLMYLFFPTQDQLVLRSGGSKGHICMWKL